MEKLNTLVIDMTAEEGNRLRINGEKIDMSTLESIDIHIERMAAIIKTVENKIYSFGDKT